MKVLIVDRDPLTAQLLQNRLENDNHQVVVEPVRKTALEMLTHTEFDIIAIDPAPLPTARQVTLPLRWEQRDNYFYLIQLGHEPDPQEVVRCGLNDMIAKPFDWQDVQRKMVNAERLIDFMRRLRETDDIATTGMTFSKRSFYKLVLSALDRAYRYGEQAYLLMIRINNLEAIAQRSGPAAAQSLLDMTGTYLTKLHRMSDFLGRTDQAEHALLLLRPAVDTEPQDAAERFTIAMREFQAQLTGPDRPEYAIELWALPSAAVLAQSLLTV
jgi:PleD family two-component response regulator